MLFHVFHFLENRFSKTCSLLLLSMLYNLLYISALNLQNLVDIVQQRVNVAPFPSSTVADSTIRVPPLAVLPHGVPWPQTMTETICQGLAHERKQVEKRVYSQYTDRYIARIAEDLRETRTLKLTSLDINSKYWIWYIADREKITVTFKLLWSRLDCHLSIT